LILLKDLTGLQPLGHDPISVVHCEEGWRAFTNLPTAARWFPRKCDAAVYSASIAELRQASLLRKESLMMALIPNHGSLLTRRSIIGVAASLLCAPAIVRFTNLMPVRRLPFPYGPQYAGFVERLRFHFLEGAVRSGWNDERHGPVVGGISEAQARSAVSFAQAHGFLPPYI
jgi:hypothetical protein